LHSPWPPVQSSELQQRPPGMDCWQVPGLPEQLCVQHAAEPLQGAPAEHMELQVLAPPSTGGVVPLSTAEHVLPLQLPE